MPATGGMLYYLDADGIAAERLQSIPLVMDALRGVAAVSGLTIKSMGVQEFPIPCSYGTGLTGYMVLAESGGFLHTTAERGAIQLELHSCRPFDTERVLDEVRRHFQPTRIIRSGVVDRSLPEIGS